MRRIQYRRQGEWVKFTFIFEKKPQDCHETFDNLGVAEIEDSIIGIRINGNEVVGEHFFNY